MGRMFGTDGVRGVANRHPMTSETALRIGRAAAFVFRKNSDAGIIIGKDTRLSGDMIESALVSGICSMGVDVILAGVIPTPAVAYLATTLGAGAGIVISASHNPFEDNGIKIFRGDGFKLTDEMENEIEALLEDDAAIVEEMSPLKIGRSTRLEDGVERYSKFLKGMVSPEVLSGVGKVVVDCSNGATFEVAPAVFENARDVEILFNTPDGRNINDKCGSQHTEALAKRVLASGAALGLAFDGDGDRLIAVDEKGAAVTGDQILVICARAAAKNGKLKNDMVVSTVMSNVGMLAALKKMGITHVKSDVGDRYVLEQMLNNGASIGGEDSGHMIFLDEHTTGDGMIAALKLMAALSESGKTLSELKGIMDVFPQVLINVPVAEKPPVDSVPELKAVMEEVEKDLGEEGRVLVRYSGTQSMLRVMVEGPTHELTQAYCRKIAEVVEKKLGTG